MAFSMEEQTRILVREVYHRRVMIVTLFIIVSLVAAGVGLVMPKRYTTSTDILVDDRNILQPLMEGTAVPTGVSDRAGLARELIFGQRILRQVFEEAGLGEPDMTASEEDRALEDLKSATRVTSHGDNLIRITYQDQEPERAQKVAELFAGLFIQGSRLSKLQESREAFNFIDEQVEEYHQKLVEAERKLKEFRSHNLGARAGSESSINQRINELTSRIERTEMELKEARVQETSLQRQLSGQAAITVSLTREGQFRGQLAELQQKRDELLLRYTESHPDVRRVQSQIEALRTAVEDERQQRQLAEQAGEQGSFVDENISLNPLYQQLRSQLSEIRTRIDTLEIRLTESEEQLEREIGRGQQVHESDAVLSELNRDYDVNKEIYQDLLRRRENARVSMSMDEQDQGLALRIEEPARLPSQPDGLRLMHVAGAGLFAGLALPLVLVLLVVRFDPRLRSTEELARTLEVPVMGVIPHLANPVDRRHRRRTTLWLVFATLLWGGLFGAAGWARITGVV
ncbi:MAG: XrtA system polysaccharide chain length determinant [Pseudomonadota bacterium]